MKTERGMKSGNRRIFFAAEMSGGVFFIGIENNALSIPCSSQHRWPGSRPSSVFKQEKAHYASDYLCSLLYTNEIVYNSKKKANIQKYIIKL